VQHSDLLYAQSVKDYISLKTKHGNYLVHMTMKFIEQLLPPDHFMRVHRSYLINKAAIKTLSRMQIQIGEEIIPVGENYRMNLVYLH
jgi:DNA-binding LytR/AlgR family response regulator